MGTTASAACGGGLSGVGSGTLVGVEIFLGESLGFCEMAVFVGDGFSISGI